MRRLECMTRSEAKRWAKRLLDAGCKSLIAVESLPGVTRSSIIKHHTGHGVLGILRTPEDCERFLARHTA